MRFEKYSKYKDSGIEWIGEIPEHWEVIRLKRVIKNNVNGIWGNELKGRDGIIVVRVADFDYDKLKTSQNCSTKRYITKDEKLKRKLNLGDLLIEGVLEIPCQLDRIKRKD